MNNKQKIESLLKKGKLRYVLLQGVLIWGLLSATLVLLIHVALGEKITFVWITLNYILFPLGGIFWGLVMWTHLTKRYQQLNQEREA